MRHSGRIYIKKIRGKGWGVFAATDIRKGAVVERVPVILVPTKHMAGGMDNPTLQKFFFLWTRSTVGIALGYGSLYNHSWDPNADFFHGEKMLTYRAVRPIAADEEITINYNGNPDDKTPMIFDVR